MKTKFLSVCLGISAVLLSASTFIYSITPAKAAEPVILKGSTTYASGGVEFTGIGISNGYAYYISNSNGSTLLAKSALTEFK